MFNWFSKKSDHESSLRLRISAFIEKDGDGYHAFAPAFRGLHVDGSTEAEVVENLKEAIVVYLRSLSEHNDPLPIGPDLSVHEVIRVPEGALLRNLTVQWSSTQMCGIS